MRDLGRELDDAGGTPVNGVTHDAQPHTSSTTLVRRLALSAITAGLMAAGGMVLPWHTAAAETHTNCIQFDPSGSVTLTPDCSETIHGVLGPPQPPLEVINPCNGDTGALSLDIAQAVYHITVNGAGDAWDTGTTTGTAVFTDDAGSSGSGTFELVRRRIQRAEHGAALHVLRRDTSVDRPDGDVPHGLQHGLHAERR
jgi:hypothetical protein